MLPCTLPKGVSRETRCSSAGHVQKTPSASGVCVGCSIDPRTTLSVTSSQAAGSWSSMQHHSPEQQMQSSMSQPDRNEYLTVQDGHVDQLQVA